MLKQDDNSVDIENTHAYHLREANQVLILVHCHPKELFQIQKRAIESIGRVNIHHHLHCQENADNTGNIENILSYDLIIANQVLIPVYCHSEEPFQIQK